MVAVHDKINTAKLLDTALSRIFQTVEFPNIHSADADDLGTRSNRGNLLCSTLSLLYITTNDTGIGTEVNQRADLGTANGASAACTEDHLVCWEASASVIVQGRESLTEDAILPDVAHILRFLQGHDDGDVGRCEG